MNLDDWNAGGGNIDGLIKQLNDWPITDLKEVKIINQYHEVINIYPYNIWESALFNGDFVHEKTLEFRLNKDYDDFEKRYKVMLTVIFDLMIELKEEALFISNDVTELCSFRKDGEINLNNKTGIWDRNYFKDVIQDKNTRIIIPYES